MQTVFGPVPSRRLGQSLGIDPLPGGKTCNWNCIYCQLGRTRPLTNQRRVYVPVDRILEDLRKALSGLEPTEVDWITFVASGETLLHSGMGELIRAVKELAPYPVAVITNGSLLFMPEVRRELLPADAVMPSLDAGEAKLFRKITRHHRDLGFRQHVDGLMAFRAEYTGQLWLETMLMRDINDGDRQLRDLADVVARIRPDSLHLVSPTRPPVEPWVRPVTEEGLARARAILGEAVEILQERPGVFELGEGEDPKEAVLAIIIRHPMREDLLQEALAHWKDGVVDRVLAELARDPRVQVVERFGCRFWSGSRQVYPD
ncbi:MAG: radical SAM protein [Acidobacteria bacterium]|nr:MAG: radical SAM protein [Acidobacteriota bacterium]